MKKPIPLDKTISIFDLCKKIKMKTFANFMVGFPNETAEDIKKTEVLMRRLKPDFCSVCITTPFPGTELFNYAIQKGIIDKEGCEDLEYNVYRESNSCVSTVFSPQEILQFKNKLQNINFYRNYIKIFFNIKNLKYILMAFYAGIIHPVLLLKAVRQYIKNKDFDIIVIHFYRSLHRLLLSRKRAGKKG
ncbi:MAG TPA: hypothetical protein ENH41_03095 [Candidatus Omnitrophica bacterium]|nr:hypothetical protein [Candidatus Omnitrophota bacterium]